MPAKQIESFESECPVQPTDLLCRLQTGARWCCIPTLINSHGCIIHKQMDYNTSSGASRTWGRESSNTWGGRKHNQRPRMRGSRMSWRQAAPSGGPKHEPVPEHRHAAVLMQSGRGEAAPAHLRGAQPPQAAHRQRSELSGPPSSQSPTEPKPPPGRLLSQSSPPALRGWTWQRAACVGSAAALQLNQPHTPPAPASAGQAASPTRLPAKGGHTPCST